MKYIKKFNEELKPQVYRSAASKFKYYGKEEKHRKLSDWADLKEFGFYNMNFANGSQIILKDAKFTKPALIGIYTKGPSHRDNALNLMGADESSIDNEINKLVQNWVGGDSDLAIYFEFGFKPTEEAILKSQNHSYLTKFQKGIRWINEVPMFTICLGLSEWSDGLEEYDNDDFESIPTTIDDFYDFTKQTDYTLFKPYADNYFGLFSDRQSAQKFKKFFIETMNSDMVKHKITDILGIINASGNNLEEVFKSFTDIKIHGLYVEDPKAPQNIIDHFLKKID